MVKKFTLNCNVENEVVAVDFYVGDPNDNSHPIGFQMKFLSQKGVVVPENIVQSLANLHQLAKKNAIPFEEMIEYVSSQLSMEESISKAFDSINSIKT